MSTSSDVTLILQEARSGSEKAYKKLFPLVYDRLKDIAYQRIKRESEHTFSKTDLVHEAYFQLVNINNVDWKDRTHFYAIASRCMRQILIDYARKKKAEKRGGDQQPSTYIDEIMVIEQQAEDLINLDEALKQLEELNPRLAEVVECRYFGEMTIEDTAAALDVSESTVNRDWAKAKGWLYKELKGRFG
ncbi:MAG: sigma-70 family RNA polymerase sigma factor [Balneolaceae bacterium]|nr:sigma-70 family RNA polymerase sigma factor [Balneolaceae bacterium]